MTAAATAAAVVSGAPERRRQRVKVPMRLVDSAAYGDVALSVYVKVKALGLRPEGCQARADTVASYLKCAVATVERGLKQLAQAAPDGVVELATRRRTHRGGQGQSALREVRPMGRTERFIWLPVAAAEDLTPRQLRAYAVIAYAAVQEIPLTEGELAQFLRHFSGKRAGQPITVTAAGQVVDELEAARWVTVQRRAGPQGRHRFIAHDIPPAAVSDVADDASEEAVDDPALLNDAGEVCSQVGEGSGSPDGEGSLATGESPMTDRLEDAVGFSSPAVGEVPVVEAVENAPGFPAPPSEADGGGLALRADEKQPPAASSSRPDHRGASQKQRAKGPYRGPELQISAAIFAVLEPVRLLLQRCNAYEQREVAREVGRQLRRPTVTEVRLRQRLERRFASVTPSEIRRPGGWLLNVALPQWGCDAAECEEGVIWSTGEPCHWCEEILADRRAERRRERAAAGLCLEHGRPPSACTACESSRAPVVPPAPAPRPQAPPRGTCVECGCTIYLIGEALEDSLCKPDRLQLRGELPVTVVDVHAGSSEGGPPNVGTPVTCAGWNGARCGRPIASGREVCVRCEAAQLAAA